MWPTSTTGRPSKASHRLQASRSRPLTTCNRRPQPSKSTETWQLIMGLRAERYRTVTALTTLAPTAGATLESMLLTLRCYNRRTTGCRTCGISRFSNSRLPHLPRQHRRRSRSRSHQVKARCNIFRRKVPACQPVKLLSRESRRTLQE